MSEKENQSKAKEEAAKQKAVLFSNESKDVLKLAEELKECR